MVATDTLPKGRVEKTYTQGTIRARIEAFLLDNVGRVVTREMIQKVARDPRTGTDPENWHQRLSELRTDSGYRILSNRDDPRIGLGEYLLASPEKFAVVNKRLRPTAEAWKAVLARASGACEWVEDGVRCGLKEGDSDPVGGGTVHLTPNHNDPHSLANQQDPDDSSRWGALCGRHQVTSKNFFVDTPGKLRLNYIGIIQAAGLNDKREVFRWLSVYFERLGEFKFDPLPESLRPKRR